MMTNYPEVIKLTMSSREIAELVGSKHGDVKRSAERLFSAGILTSPLAQFDFVHNGNTYNEYHFNKRDSLVLVARLSPEFTAAVVDRWQRLEQEKALGFNPEDPIAVLENLVATKKALAIAAPKAEVFDKIIDRGVLMTATQVGQKIGISAMKLNQHLSLLDVYNGNVKRARAFKQWFIDKKYGEMKQTEMGYSQPLFTNAGEMWIIEKLTSEGVI